MKKIDLTMMSVDTIKAIIKAHGITTPVTIEETEDCGIGTVITMSWVAYHKGYETKMTVTISDERDW